MAHGRPFPLQVAILLVYICRYAALGQSIAFVPWSDDFDILAGESYLIQWTGGDSQDVIISLVPAGNTNDILDLVFNGPPVPSNFTWVPPYDLDPLTLYRFQLNQGSADVFSSTFIVAGGNASATTSSSSVSPVYPSYTGTAPSSITGTAASSRPAPSTTSSTSLLSAQPVASISNTPSSSPTPTPSPPGLGPGAIAGIVIGSIGALALIMIACLLILRHRRRNLSDSDRSLPSNRYSDMSELSAGFRANRHEAESSVRTSPIVDQEHSGGSSVRGGGTTTINTGGMQELPVW